MIRGLKKEHTDIVDDLRQLGAKRIRVNGDEISCCCPNPAHKDKVPSFNFNWRNGLYSCFGCDLRGKGITSLYKKCGREYHGLHHVYSGRPEEKPAPGFIHIPESVIEELDHRYDYLESRGISAGTQKEWNVRYSVEDNRYVIPVYLRDGRLVGYIGIAGEELRAKGAKKVLYSVGFPVRATLFGINRVVANEYVILVEGAIDVLKLSEAGENHALAILGSHLTEGQSQALMSLCPKIIYTMFDNDDAGHRITQVVYDWAKLRRIPIKCINYKDEDPAAASAESLVDILRNVQFDYHSFSFSLL